MSKRICVIGAGLAGGIVAADLAARGHQVTLVEQGNAPVPSMPPDEDWKGDDIKSVFTRGEGIGGSSNFWHGGLIALDRTDIEGTDVSGTRARYPIPYSELCEYYRSALRLIANDDITLEDLAPSAGKDPNFRVDDERFLLKPLFFPPKPFSTKGLVEKAVREHGLTLVTDFTVERLLVSEGSRVTGVEGRRAGSDKPSSISADLFVLCAGGIGSPKILLSSASQSPALKTLPLGRNLIDHPTGFVFKARLRKRVDLSTFFGKPHHAASKYRRRWGIVLRPEHLDAASGRNHVVYLRPAFSMRNPEAYNALKARLVAHRGKRLAIRDIFELALHADLLMEAVNFRFGLSTSARYVSGFVFAEQLTGTDNAIELAPNGRYTVRWGISPEDAGSLQEFLAAFVAAHPDMFEEVRFFPGLLGSGAHHSGGCRMAWDGTDGVVDANLRVFGISNLHVADGSVLAYSGHANTGLTIAAFALKCADAVHSAVKP